ncbi:MAG: hypothetical protein LBH45_07165 [Campylobacteraceae bacterium]|jgi:hypothetical protein|nr:hypothetical protein [Campylobacteraceae bacterium]
MSSDIEKLIENAKKERAEAKKKKGKPAKRLPPLPAKPEDKEGLELLRKAIKHESNNASAVAKRTGYNKATISLIRKNRYTGGTKKFFARLKAAYDFLENGTVKCPGLKGDMHLKVCKSYREAVREGKTLKGTAFAQVRELCPFCPLGDIKND